MIAPIVSRVRRNAPAETSRNQIEPASDERDDAERQQGELHVEEQQHRDGADEREAGLEQRHHRVRDEAFQRLDVVGHARDQHAGRAALVEADRLVLQVGEDADAQVRERALADPADEIGLHVGHRPHEQRRCQERDHDEHERLGVVAVDALVDRDPRQQRRRQRGGRAEYERHQHRDDAQAVGAQQSQQAAQVAPARAFRRRAPRPTVSARAAAAHHPCAAMRAHIPLTSRSRGSSRVRKT